MAEILVVDDSSAILEIARRSLETAGHTVVAARDGVTAADMIAAGRTFEVAVVDYQIPGPNGLQLLALINRHLPTCARILASGALDLDVAVQAVNLGGLTHIVPKPFTPTRLLAAVDDVLARRARTCDAASIERDSQRARERAALLDMIDGSGMRLAIQPIFSVEDLVPVAYEALLRSADPRFPGPGEVISAAERHELVGRLADNVFRRAHSWLAQLDHGKLFINMHPDELGDADAVAARLELLAPFADRVVLEVTERAKLGDGGQWRRSIAMIRERGFALAVDDIGAGYSSLSAILELDPAYIKLDMGMVRDVDTALHKRRMMVHMCEYARDTGVLVVAEGIETHAELDVVRDSGVDFAQGFLLGRPAFQPVRFPSFVDQVIQAAAG